MNKPNQSIPDRRFKRIKLDAPILLTNADSEEYSCHCSHFSEDGIDLERHPEGPTFNDMRINAGSVVQLQIEDLASAPKLKAVVIGISPMTLSLRFLL